MIMASLPVLPRNTTAVEPVITPVLAFGVVEIIEIVNYVFICFMIALFGTVANVINLIIFYKQGFTSSVNVSFFAMAISDLGCLTIIEFFSLCAAPFFHKSDIPFYAREVRYLIGLMNIYFGRVTSWITAFVTAERCLGITIPLKVKDIITPKRTAIVICSIYCVNLVTFVPEYLIASLDWKFFPDKNKTLIGVVYVEDKGLAGLLIFILTPVMGLLSIVLVMVFTTILVFKLKEKSKWRLNVVGDKKQCGSLSTRDKKTMKMVVAIACLLISSYMPGIAVTGVTVFEPEFMAFGAYANLFNAVWSFPFIGQTLNSSINIIFYYRMSVKYRETFQELFSACRRTTKDIKEK